MCVLASIGSRLMRMCVDSLCVCARLIRVCAESSARLVCVEFACMCVSEFRRVVVHFICICLSTDVDELTP